ncbi:putative 2-dehydropantoate 2-reductase [Colletotrichum truncatum]|uniref:2-dehydropantoate 2-reductase n=1 Tax=Colletotrichum truncatum TaxID=5467 RepID=A0ACC3YGV6_COLTU|nr:putative 2-dehydropantoate 2-reductase [Colletotrichum truncatum]KAF6784056.1 putative 2-dehydropantoate 2-reductase [Colletotrichum truncatum]
MSSSSRTILDARRMSPEWLQSVLNIKSSAPKLYAWNPSDVEPHAAPTDHINHSQVNYKEGSDSRDDLCRRIYILGIGNLGILFASALATLPNPPPVTLVFHKKELLLSWKHEPGIEIKRDSTISKYSNLDVELWSEEPPVGRQSREVANGESIRNLIVTTKASQALPEVDRVRRYLDSNSTVAFAQNGMCKMWPPHGTTYNTARYSQDQSSSHPNWLACVTTHGVTSLGRFKSEHASEADIKVGPVLLNSESHTCVSYLSKLLVRAPHLKGTAVARNDLWILQLEKLVVNSIINPLTAVLRCKNGQLFVEKDGPTAQLMDSLLTEASAVLQAVINDSSADSILQTPSNEETTSNEKQVARRDLLERFSQPRLKKMLYEVGYKVRENTSSMLQDVRAGKQTEIDEFNGWLVDMAAYLDGDLDVSCHKTLIGLVKNGSVLQADSLSNHFPHLMSLRAPTA